ncbi:type I restriction-modification system subunit M [Fodinibius sp. SL11]|uniref:type I restriction-modification system subunit M n=1 Tax=Fodinibius sp. SL11 TaxID=3425690 RepID=UPI003F881457
MTNFRERANFIWDVANLIRDSFKRGKYQDVILPFTVLRRVDSVLQPNKEEVLTTYNKYKDKLEDMDDLLRQASGYAFYNTTKYDFERLLADHEHIADNLRRYINGFSDNMREVLYNFDFDNTIRKLDDQGLLYQVMQRFNEIDLHPDTVSNMEMGYIFEELIRKFNEATNENPGEHFTPREVINLMANIALEPDLEELQKEGIIVKVYDPACGTGGMLSITKDKIQEINPDADVRVFGQELNPETYAVSKSDFFLKTSDGKDAENILQGSTLSDPKHSGETFNYMLANPPYGKDWKRDKKEVQDEADRGYAGRFGAGTPRKNDGQLLFTQDMLSHKAPFENGKGGSRIAVIHNGSPLFTGDAGSGESEIRRWILENDWLEAIVALPEQLFYNTGIATYIWILTNKKSPERKGKVQLIDASDIWEPMRKSLGDKRRQISDEQIKQITQLYEDFEEGEKVKIFENEEFGYRKVRIEQPLRLNYHAIPERIERLKEERVYQNFAKSRKKNKEEKQKEIEEGKKEQQFILDVLHSMSDEKFTNSRNFFKRLKERFGEHDYKPKKSLLNAIERAIGEKDEDADIVRDKKGNPESDTDLRDYENVPLNEDVFEYFEREVKPHVPEAWIDEDYTDEKDGEVGRVGYEIPFTRHFYEYEPPRPLDEIEDEIKTLEEQIQDLMQEVID